MKHLPDCFAALAAQTFRNFECLMVDNGSTDGSLEFMKQHHPWVRLLPLGENQGFCGGNNAALKEVQGEYVALLNNDTAVAPTWLESLCRALDEHPEIGFCASKMMRFYERDTIDTAGDLVTTACNTLDRGRGTSGLPEFDVDAEVFGACAGASIYRWALLERVGWLDEDFYFCFEDIDLSFRAQLAGFRCLYVAGAVVYHKWGGTMSVKDGWRIAYSQRNIEFVWLKNMPAALMLRYFHERVIYWLGSAVHFARQGQLRPFCKAKWSALRMLPTMLRKRRQIQSSRVISNAELSKHLESKWLGAKFRRMLNG